MVTHFDAARFIEGRLTFAASSPEETKLAAEALGTLCEGGEVLLLNGDLGSGKTSFTQGLARGLGVDPAKRVTSPTFTLHGEYPGRLVLNHVDLYRLGDAEEAVDFGIFDLLHAKDSVLAVEWPELLDNHIKEEFMRLRLEYADDPDDASPTTRIVSATAEGGQHTKLLSSWAEIIRSKLGLD